MSTRGSGLRGLSFFGLRRSDRDVSRLAPALLASAVALAACGHPATPPAAPVTPVAPAPVSATPAPAPAPAEIPLPAGVPDTPAGHQLAWVLSSFAKSPTPAEASARMAPAFATAVPPEKVAAIFAHLGPQLAPLIVDRVEPGPSAETLSAVVHSGQPGAPPDAKLKIVLQVEAAAPFRMTGLLMRPMVDAKPAVSWEEVESTVRAVAPQTNLLAAEIDGGKCVPVASLEPKKPLAMGSAFKLYVLDALARQIAAGTHAWTDTLTVDDAKKSLPSGEMRDEPAGKTFTVREVAERMISVSDNTAADHLLAFVGRKAVEDAVKASGHAAPARMVPFLSTRELFALKLLTTPEEQAAYVRADVPHKRKLLETYGARDLSKALSDGQGWGAPRQIDTLEWFASPEDICKLMVSLKQYADAPATAPVGAILALNPGVPDDKGLYRYIGFKGGSEPGVLDMTWLLQRKDAGAAGAGKWLFLTVGFNDAKSVLDEGRAITAATVARDFLGK